MNRITKVSMLVKIKFKWCNLTIIKKNVKPINKMNAHFRSLTKELILVVLGKIIYVGRFC